MLKTLDQSLHVVKYFTRENPQWGVRELAKEMDTSHSVVYRILATFEKHGFLEQNEETKKYQLSIKFMEYGAITRDQYKISDIIYPVMRELSDETGESIFLTWRDGQDGICVEICESPQKIKYALSVGSRTPLYAGASNKIIMAYLSAEVQESITAKGLKPKTRRTIIDEQRLLADLQTIRQAGWAHSLGEYSDAVFGIAVPLFNRKNEVIASLTVAGPEYRMPEENVEKTLLALKRSRDEVQKILHNQLVLNPRF